MADEVMQCPYCAETIKVGAIVCRFCNRNLLTGEDSLHQTIIIQQAEESAQKNKITAFVLAVFLGWIGGHKFYLDQRKAGVLYLLFFWTFIPMAISIFEAIGYLLMSKKAFQEKYGDL